MAIAGDAIQVMGALLDHLSAQLLESYGRRLLEASELLALDDHLLTCPACCERWRQATTRVTALLALQASLQLPDEAATTHWWRPLVGAISYQVIISDPAASYQEVASSSQLKGIHWTVDRPLKRGRVYAWQIIMDTADGELKAPGPEAPAAKFKVLDHGTASKLAQAKKNYAGRHLTLGLLYAEAGLLDEAERELEALVAANPRSQIAKSLWLDLRSKHQRP